MIGPGQRAYSIAQPPAPANELAGAGLRSRRTDPEGLWTARIWCSIRRKREAIGLRRFAAVAAFVAAGAVQATAQAPVEIEPEAVYTVLLESPSVGERLRVDAVIEGSTGPVRRSAASIGLLRRAVVRGQNPVVEAIERLDVDVIGSTSHVLNALFVRATLAEVEALRRLPGVGDVVPSRRHETAVGGFGEIIKVDAARMRPSGTPLQGEGVKIAVIDTGADFTHPALQDDTLAPLAGYPKGDLEYLDLASNKIIAVRSYVEMLNSGTPANSSPDDDSPADGSSHGTAVAMLAAGNVVETPLGLHSGVAPKARIGVYKVFGTRGINFSSADHAIVAAIDDAVADGMDILNLSLGHAAFWKWDDAGRACSQRSGFCDPVAQAAQSAVVDFGRVVVAAAGNNSLIGTHEEPALSTIYTPGIAPAVVAVGGTLSSHERFRRAVRIGDRSYEASAGTGPIAEGPLTLPPALAWQYGNAKACDPFPRGAFRERIVIVERGDCFFWNKIEHADASGAAGIVVVNNTGDDLVHMAAISDTDIPAVFIGNSDGIALLAEIESTSAPVTIDPTPMVEDREWNRVFPEGGRGPTLSAAPKPDLVAPADLVYAASPRYSAEGVLFAPSGYRQQSGTSFAAPIVAGAAALVWQANPGLTANGVRSALINTATLGTLDLEDEPARLSAVGAGVLDIESALRSTVVAEPPIVAFGDVARSRFPVRRTVTLTSTSTITQSYRLTVEATDSAAGVRVLVGNSQSTQVQVRPGRGGSTQVTLQGRAPPAGSYEGYIRVTSLSSGQENRIPYMFAVPSNVAHDALRFAGGTERGPAGESNTKNVIARVIDQAGLPVVNRAVTFQVTQGAATIGSGNGASGRTGLIFASVTFTGQPSVERVSATMDGLNVVFAYEANQIRPEILSIANAAKGESPDGVAPGSLVTISGVGISQAPSGEASERQASQLSMTRKGVSVAFDGSNGVSEPGRIFAVGADWVTVQVPWELRGSGQAYVKVRSGPHSRPYRFNVATVDPGIFEYELDGVELASATHPDGSPVTVGSPTHPGASVTLSMTGNGPVLALPRSGFASSAMVATSIKPTAEIGGAAAPVSKSVLAPDLAGVYAVTLTVPLNARPGLQPVVVKIGARRSNAVLLPVEWPVTPSAGPTVSGLLSPNR